MKEDVAKEMTAILRFLDAPTTYLHCALLNAHGQFHRNKTNKRDERELYDRELRDMVDSSKREVYSKAFAKIGHH